MFRKKESEGPQLPATPEDNHDVARTPNILVSSPPDDSGLTEIVRLSGSGAPPNAIAQKFKDEGDVLMADSKYEAAIAAFSRAIVESPNNGDYYAARSLAYLSAKMNALAMEDATTAVTAAPTSWEAWTRIGTVKAATGDILGAQEAFKKSLEWQESRENAPSLQSSPQIAPAALPSPTTPSSPRPTSAAEGSTSISLSTQMPPIVAPLTANQMGEPSSPPSYSLAPDAAGVTMQGSNLTSASFTGVTKEPTPEMYEAKWQIVNEKIEKLNCGSLNVSCVLTSIPSVSYFAYFTGSSELSEEKDLDVQKSSHPAFDVQYYEKLKSVATDDFIILGAENNFYGTIPGTVSLKGFSWLHNNHIKPNKARTFFSSRASGPSVTMKELIDRINELKRLGGNISWISEKNLYDDLMKIMSDSTAYVDPASRYTIGNQISMLVMWCNRSDLFVDLQDNSVISGLFSGMVKDFRFVDFAYQIVCAYELYIRLKDPMCNSFYLGCTGSTLASMIIAKQWIDGVTLILENDKCLFRSKVHERQVDALIQFAKLMKWPYVMSMRGELETMYAEIIGGKHVAPEIWDWLFGLTLPGKYFSNKIMSCILLATPETSKLGISRYYDSGLVLRGVGSWWRSTTVLGRVLGGLRGIKECCGWIGLCQEPDIQREKAFYRIHAREIMYPNPNMDMPIGLGNFVEDDNDDNDDDDNDANGNDLHSALSVPKPGETTQHLIDDLSDTNAWVSPPFPPPLDDTVFSLTAIKLRALPLPALGKVDVEHDDTEFVATLTFALSRPPAAGHGVAASASATTLSFTLYTNPPFVTAHPCRVAPANGHFVHRRQLPAFSSRHRVVHVRDLCSPARADAIRAKRGTRVTVINAQCAGGEAVARAWCAERGLAAVVRRRGPGAACYTCAVHQAGEGMSLGVLIWA
ncbi:hypothetical protein HK405_007900 [Cladochytrium tenue]|nr:hypothetical protein HK405_007900 [Cladochytrium tenue]